MKPFHIELEVDESKMSRNDLIESWCYDLHDRVMITAKEQNAGTIVFRKHVRSMFRDSVYDRLKESGVKMDNWEHYEKEREASTILRYFRKIGYYAKKGDRRIERLFFDIVKTKKT